jgi:AraC-like DNA-binding protein
VDETRHTLAVRYVREGRLSNAEVASRLGYENVNAFFRAFRRWTGTTPRRFQRE